MSQHLAESLDLRLAWQRARFDRPDRCFVTHPFMIDLIELELDAWVTDLGGHLVAGFVPSPSIICHEPKGGGFVRPGTHLRLEDEVVFNALLGTVFRNIGEVLRWSQGNPDVAYQLAISHDNPEWVSRGFVVWKQFREKSLAYIDQGAEFVLFADISAFYENVDLPRLASDLNRVGIDQEARTLLSRCLNRWADPRGKGIPQGYSAADILAKLYLEPVDQSLRNEGFKHLRYVDDIRVFCRSELVAKRALLRLSELLRLRGLNLQSAKTYILSADEAAVEIDGVAPVIASIQEELKDELIREYAIAGPYATLDELERIASAHPDRPPVEVLERAFQSHFLDAGEKHFDKTLFHYLLTRLGQVGSRNALDYCLSLFAKRPEETKAILNYFTKIGLSEENKSQILEFLASEEAIYDYQKFLILRFFFEQFTFPDALLQQVRRAIRDRNSPPWLRSYAAAILGEAGTTADLESLEANYPACADDLERSEIICSLRRMEVGRRNAFIGRARRDGPLAERAARWLAEHPV
jgi:reverse transcriptase-like protein